MGSVRKSPRNPSRWEARYRDRSNRQRTKTFESRASAKAWLAATEADLGRGTWIDPSFRATKLAIVAEHWLASDHRKRSGSIARDRSILATHILPAVGTTAVGAITRGDVQNLVNDWCKSCAASTVHRQYACLRGLFSYAESCELIVRSPCRNIRLPDVSPRDAKILDGAQLEHLAEGMGDYSSMLYLAAMGLRWGEIAGLRVGAIDFLRGTVTIVRQRTRGASGRMVDQEPKTRTSRRSLSVPEWVMTMLAEHLAARGVNGGDAEALVFVSPGGEPLHYSNWRRRVWLPALARAGFEDLTFHDLKHTAATTLVEEGVDIKTAQLRLGHANPQTTLRVYAQVTRRADRAAAERVGERLRPQGGDLGDNPSGATPPATEA